MFETFHSPEEEREGRLLEGEEREREIQERREYLEGLEEMLRRTDLSEEERSEIEVQYEGLKEFLDGMQEGDTVRIITEGK